MSGGVFWDNCIREINMRWNQCSSATELYPISAFDVRTASNNSSYHPMPTRVGDEIIPYSTKLITDVKNQIKKYF